MEAIKFKAKDQNQKDFANELTKRVRKYFKEKDKSTFGGGKILFKAILMLGLYITPLVLIFTINLHPLMALTLIVLMGIGKAGIGMGVMHDAAHGTFSKYKWLNSIMAGSIFLFGTDLINWKIQHNVLHHSYPNVYKWDNDIDTKGIIRLSNHAEHHKIYKYQYIFGPFLYSFMTLSKFIGDFQQLITYHRLGALKIYSGSLGKNFRNLLINKIIYLGVFIGMPFIFTDFSWWQILLGFSIMHFTASMIMGTVFQMAHVVEGMSQPLPDENGVINNQFYVHQLETTSDFGKRKSILGWYIGGLDFQAIHHLFPNISHVHYPDLSLIVELTAAEYGQPYHCKKSFASAYKSHIKTLKRLGKES
ncbi:acyl-CoA desaturase [Paracrocinitomix mangrovi]|uniref:fatty acid desaturase family protein n=1 Tax=Paracrocinitomix mangrovi TaxID=2862509 RepID=UPI001C8E258E|nr:acyl-CoA desaturase [Paracrocinitomix mangrovi]UKN02330.1 acyl-CoA desaturase [Paracrocinitomix mangrovi]